MCCTVTQQGIVLPLLVAALIALGILVWRPFRYRGIVLAGWALVPVWAALVVALLLALGGQGSSGLFVAALAIALFQPMWLVAVAAGALLGLALRHGTLWWRRRSGTPAP